MPYKYGWGVEESGAGLNYGQNEESDGSVVTGQYRVLLPDGRTQIVRYPGDSQTIWDSPSKIVYSPGTPARHGPCPIILSISNEIFSIRKKYFKIFCL